MLSSVLRDTAIMVITAVVVATYLLSYTTERARQAADEGYAAGIAARDIKSLIVDNHQDLNKVCKTWWFDMTHQERKLDVPSRKKQNER